MSPLARFYIRVLVAFTVGIPAFVAWLCLMIVASCWIAKHIIG